VAQKWEKRGQKMIKNEPKISPIFWKNARPFFWKNARPFFWKNRRRGLELEKDPQKSWKSIQH